MTTPTTSRPVRGACDPAARRRGLAATARRIAIELTPQTIEQIANRVAQLLPHNPPVNPAPRPATLMTVKELAHHLKLNPAWVYEHADQLGAIRTSNGPKARIRFEAHTATQALKRHQRPSAPTSAPRPRRTSPRPAPYPADAPMLEIRRQEIRGERSCVARRRRRIGVL